MTAPAEPYDVAYAGDLADPELAADVAEELAAAAAAGWRCAAVPAVRPERGLAPDLARLVLAGTVDVVAPDEPAQTRLLVAARGPGGLPPAAALAQLRASTLVLLTGSGEPVASEPAAQLPGATAAETVHTAAREAAGRDTLFWPRVIDHERWRTDRSIRRPGPPVVAALLPADPARAAELRALLANDLGPGSGVRVLLVPTSAGPAPRWRRLPRTWSLACGSPRQALADADAVLDPLGWGGPTWLLRTWAAGALVADGSGRTPGRGVLRCEPAALAGTLGRLLDDPATLEQLRTEGTARLRDHQPAAYATRLGRLLAAPSVPGVAIARPSMPPAKPLRVLFVSSNGAGMGHLTRLMAMARRASPGIEPVFASFSQAVPVVRAEGFAYEYVPSRDDLSIGPRRWNRLLAQRFVDIFDRVRPSAVVFDGTYPYDGLFRAGMAEKGARLVWSRRAMWRPGLGLGQLARSGQFDLVLEPGEVAGAADRGATVERTDAVRVRPVVLLDESDLLDRESAMAELGLNPERPAVLVTLGAGNLDDQRSLLGRVVAAVASDRDVQVCVTTPVIAYSESHLAHQVHRVSVYPISRCFHAFDYAVSAAGYNSFHELVGFGVPTAWVPNLETGMDDQEARARWAGEAGIGTYLAGSTDQDLDAALAPLRSTADRQRMRERCREVWPGNGARDAMAAVERTLGLAEPPRAGADAAGAAGAAGATAEVRPAQVRPVEVRPVDAVTP